MGNLDFSGHALFSWYVILLILSGIAMLGLSGLTARPLRRVVNFLFGLGFVGYGIYLGWIWQGGTYLVFFKAFLLPIVLTVSTVRAGLVKRTGRTTPAAQQAPIAPPTLPAGAPTPPPGDYTGA